MGTEDWALRGWHVEDDERTDGLGFEVMTSQQVHIAFVPSRDLGEHIATLHNRTLGDGQEPRRRPVRSGDGWDCGVLHNGEGHTHPSEEGARACIAEQEPITIPYEVPARRGLVGVEAPLADYRAYLDDEEWTRLHNEALRGASRLSAEPVPLSTTEEPPLRLTLSEGGDLAQRNLIQEAADAARAIDEPRLPVDSTGVRQVYEPGCVPGCDYSITGYHAKRGGRQLCQTAANTPRPYLPDDLRIPRQRRARTVGPVRSAAAARAALDVRIEEYVNARVAEYAAREPARLVIEGDPVAMANLLVQLGWTVEPPEETP